MKNQLVRPVIRLTETAMMIALGTVLSLLSLFNPPYGGSITPAAMLPMVMIAYRHKTAWGLGAAAVYACVQLLFGLDNFGYVPGVAAVICIFLFDYFVAYTAMGLGGLFRKLKDPALGLALGSLVACLARYLCHVVSGCTVWASTPFMTDAAAISFSFAYNASYMLPQTVIEVAAAWVIGGALDLRSPRIGRVARESVSPLSSVFSLIGKLAAAGGAAYLLVELSVAVMTALDAVGYDSSAFALSAVILPWQRMLIVAACCAVAAVAFLALAKAKNKNKS